ncbi:MAG TPA: orotidine-5'-phosphate decarboxylase [Gammaproteobacteria bacterium]|nr:orotidine-5'-phosphate decarboxylase [Gammaproteobacteria bacterium]|tara:strand:+ start:5467 stop:6195 length:729 start_codon:yes stop_codon:yes gene_type:complete
MGKFDRNCVIVALDFASESDALSLLECLDPKWCRIKIGKELFTRTGPAFVRRVIESGFDVFLDLKYHDIPNTVAGACSAAAELGCWMVNVHASGGREMMVAAADRLAHYQSRPLLVAVTVLTSLDYTSLIEVGYKSVPAKVGLQLAALTQQCGLDGVVCSVHEVESIKRQSGPEFLTVTPGIRPNDGCRDDQRRVATPAEALKAGADFLVVGRPVTRAANGGIALKEIYAEIAASQALGVPR